MSLMYTVNAITITFYSLAGPLLYKLGGFPLLVIIACVFLAIALYIITNLKIKE